GTVSGIGRPAFDRGQQPQTFLSEVEIDSAPANTKHKPEIGRPFIWTPVMEEK
ncbi:hypothetical protein HispidOSU_026487, partial [Sigmodon hispidus]